MERQDIQCLKRALNAAQLGGIRFTFPGEKITLQNGATVPAEAYIQETIKSPLRNKIAAEIISVLERHGWNGEY